MPEYGIWTGELEVRQDGANPVLTGRFPLNVTATVSNRGRQRKERFLSGSMSWQVREFQKLQIQLADVISGAVEDMRKERMVAQLEDALEKRNTHLLVGHDFGKAVADMRSGNLAIEHTPSEVRFEAMLPPEGEQPSWIRDAVLGVRGGQLRGGIPGV